MYLILVLILTLCIDKTVSQLGQGADGNPHGWDRRRRCDHTDYTPKCGLCEGYGGIPTGDNNDEITLTTCKPIANASDIDPNTLKRPVWSKSWSSHSWEILIGPKRDPFCFQTFPSNSSVGKLCYRAQTGIQNYDFENAKALREDIEISTKVGNVTTMLIHQGPNMWIVNKFPWYALGVHQCVCTQPKQGGDKTAGKVYPIQSNWTDNLFYIGRESIKVEYDQGIHTLDHWAFGPHHVWSYPDSGQILRMWQPFNGLQVFPKGMNYQKVNESLFDEIPPNLCKKGGATFRVKCTDDGYPQESKEIKTISYKDEIRAKTKIPRKPYKGNTFYEMSKKLNGWLIKDKNIPKTKHCSDWNITEIQELQGYLFLLRNENFDEIYQKENDNRKFNGALHDIQNKWKVLNEMIKTEIDPIKKNIYHNILRDGHCHEAVMWYVHHLTHDVKKILSKLPFTLPLLSFEHHVNEIGGHCHSNHPDINSNIRQKVCNVYQEKVTCASCHANV